MNTRLTEQADELNIGIRNVGIGTQYLNSMYVIFCSGNSLRCESVRCGVIFFGPTHLSMRRFYQCSLVNQLARSKTRYAGSKNIASKKSRSKFFRPSPLFLRFLRLLWTFFQNSGCYVQENWCSPINILHEGPNILWKHVFLPTIQISSPVAPMVEIWYTEYIQRIISSALLYHSFARSGCFVDRVEDSKNINQNLSESSTRSKNIQISRNCDTVKMKIFSTNLENAPNC